MNVLRFQILWAEICKTNNEPIPEFMNNTFKIKENKKLVREQYKLNLETT